MKLLFRQRVFSWLDSYDVYDENGKKVYEVKGQIAWGHCQKIYDNNGKELGKIQEQKIAITPTMNKSHNPSMMRLTVLLIYITQYSTNLA